MFELEHTEQIKRLIEITKSNSGISGPELAKAHIELGRLLSAYLPVEPMDTTVVAMMRGGIFFAQGIYFGLGCKFQLFDPKKDQFIRPQTKYVIVVYPAPKTAAARGLNRTRAARGTAPPPLI